MPGGLKSGFLTKKAIHGHGQWQRRFFILSTDSLSYYKDASRTSKNGKTFPIGTASVLLDSQIKDKEFAFQLESPDVDTLFLVADSEEEMTEWKKAVETAINDLKAIQDRLTIMTPSCTSAVEDTQTRGVLVQLIAAVSSADTYDCFVDNMLTFMFLHVVCFVIRPKKEWTKMNTTRSSLRISTS
jgi:hypothetical protein